MAPTGSQVLPSHKLPYGEGQSKQSILFEVLSKCHFGYSNIWIASNPSELEQDKPPYCNQFELDQMKDVAIQLHVPVSHQQQQFLKRLKVTMKMNN